MILSSRYAGVLAAAFLVAAVAYAVRGFTTGAALDFVLAALWVSCFVVYVLHARRARRAEKAAAERYRRLFDDQRPVSSHSTGPAIYRPDSFTTETLGEITRLRLRKDDLS